MNTTPRANRLHIAFFGQTNAGKSSIINALTGQDLALVSDVSGTTTDPVYKAMEILPIGPCMLIDTAGLNDNSPLGHLRLKKTMEVLHKTDVALIVFDLTKTIHSAELDLIQQLKAKNIPCLGIINKLDLSTDENQAVLEQYEKTTEIPMVLTSATTGQGIDTIKQTLIKHVPTQEDKFKIVGDLIRPGDFVVLVTPIDKAAPKGRLILPQQQTIRDILESDAISIVTKEQELRETLSNLGKKPSMVITDSQAFLKVSADTPQDIPLTSFSILFARHKGDLKSLVEGAAAINRLKDGDKVLIAEGCTHHRQSDDIGTVKIPRWLRQTTGKDLVFEHTAGVSFKDSLEGYSLVVHCGGCMLNNRAMEHRINSSKAEGVPIVNYGVLIAYVHGILDRALEPFPMAKLIWEQSKRS
jgi:[FeFe] hydrogenase H-cluster maturation GTPase HydF